MRRAAAALALLALAGCGGGHATGPHGSPARRPPTDRDRLQALLDRRAQALQAGRPGAYAATATGAQRGRDRAAARIASRIHLRDVRIGIRSARIDGGRASLAVIAAWGVRGIRGTFTSERRIVARRTPGGWRVSAVTTRRGLPPWEVADYAEHDAGHFAVLAPRDIAIDGLPATLEAGYAAIRGTLRHVDLRRRYLVVVAPTSAAAKRLTLGIRGIEGLAAIADTAVHEEGPAKRVTRVLSQRLLVVWPQFVALGEDERRRVVAHELTHAVLAGITSGRTPAWLVEGIALYVSGDQRDDQVLAALQGRAGAAGIAAIREFSLRALSTPDAIGRLNGARQAGAYAFASAAAFAIADRYGRQALLRLLAAFDEPSLRGKPGPGLVDRALRRTLGAGIDEIQRQIRDEVAGAAAGTSGTSTTSAP